MRSQIAAYVAMKRDEVTSLSALQQAQRGQSKNTERQRKDANHVGQRRRDRRRDLDRGPWL